MEILGFPEPDVASVERTRLELACFVGQALMSDIIAKEHVPKVLDWLDTASNKEIKSLWAKPSANS